MASQMAPPDFTLNGQSRVYSTLKACICVSRSHVSIKHE